MQADDDRPAPKIGHVIGQDLSTLSVDELRDRIEVLRGEIGRLEQAIATKTETRSAADSFFRPT